MRGDRLDYATEQCWSTPRASDGEKGGPNQSFGAGGVPLPAQSVNWATPSAADMTGSTGGGQPRSLRTDINLWMTPRVATGDYTRDGGAKGAERLTLEGQAKWSTPSVADVTGGHAHRSGARSGELLLNGQSVDLSSRLDPATPTPGGGSWSGLRGAFQRYRAETCSSLKSERRALLLMAIRRRGDSWTRKAPSAFVRPSFRRSLNPYFVSDLMGWPPGLTSFECSETASSTWRARMRCALSQLPSHDAPPAQLSLFG